MSRKAGVQESQLRAIGGFESSAEFTELEKAVLRVADGMSETPVQVTDDMIEALRPELDDPQIVELVTYLAWEQFRSRFNRTLDIPSDDILEGGYCPLPL